MKTYVYIQWPDSQEYMTEDWFKEEAILDNSENAPSSSYLIPTERHIEFNNANQLVDSKYGSQGNNIIVNIITELTRQYQVTEEEEKYVKEQFDDSIPFEGGMSISEAIIHIKNTEE